MKTRFEGLFGHGQRSMDDRRSLVCSTRVYEFRSFAVLRTTTTEVEGDNRSVEVASDGVIEHAVIVETIKGDFQMSCLVTGDVTVDAYEDDCDCSDPAGSSKGVCFSHSRLDLEQPKY